MPARDATPFQQGTENDKMRAFYSIIRLRPVSTTRVIILRNLLRIALTVLHDEQIEEEYNSVGFKRFKGGRKKKQKTRR